MAMAAATNTVMDRGTVMHVRRRAAIEAVSAFQGPTRLLHAHPRAAIGGHIRRSAEAPMSALCQKQTNRSNLAAIAGTGKFSEEGAADNHPLNFYSMILSALTSTVGGILRPSALAVFRLIHNSSSVGNSTGKSAGLVPFSILST
jgi:hypothetical protein